MERTRQREISRDGTTWSDISDTVFGLDGLDIAEAEGTTEVGGGGIRRGMALTGYVTSSSASFTVDENSRSRPLLVGWNGQTLHVRYRRDGSGSGNAAGVAEWPLHDQP